LEAIFFSFSVSNTVLDRKKYEFPLFRKRDVVFCRLALKIWAESGISEVGVLGRKSIVILVSDKVGRAFTATPLAGKNSKKFPLLRPTYYGVHCVVF